MIPARAQSEVFVLRTLRTTQGVWRLLFTRLPVKTLPNIQISMAGTRDLIIIISTSYNINN